MKELVPSLSMNKKVMKVEQVETNSTEPETVVSEAGSEEFSASEQAFYNEGETFADFPQEIQEKLTLLQLDFNAQLGELQEKHEEKLSKLAKERDEYLEQWRRNAAEFKNFKKRSEKLRVENERKANGKLLKQLLPILDDLQRAGQYVPAEISDNDWVNGMLAIERKLWNIFEQDGLSVIEVKVGESFDPTLHDALLSMEHEEFEYGQIIQELQPGYRYYDSILRPARVGVAR